MVTMFLLIAISATLTVLLIQVRYFPTYRDRTADPFSFMRDALSLIISVLPLTRTYIIADRR